ncbi:HVO_0758 family zinc finger protein [Natronorarus salvus]|uniref:HVO_0758 family zinc finger protein n=1 Tax=Natronorarus salvus TaxID=3117733 RepID=UPI002F2664E4
MKSVRKALRDGDLGKDTYDRLECAACERALSTRNDPGEIGTVRRCDDCGRRWRAIG